MATHSGIPIHYLLLSESVRQAYHPYSDFYSIHDCTGAVVAGAPPAYTSNEIAYAIQKASPRMILVDQASFQNAREVVDALHLPRECFIFMDRVISGYTSVSALIITGKSRGA
ncbi:hypothetical protein BKA64DRAFT_160702 [Cadophora sp. MPI-SDFR-AT-0126]|nr:hypothetical protein BKA64DRAFT_160702 [Leotiomycetes sp. MPI-SDFR-AT-0126]